jgi:hypothetical protein
MKIHPHFKLAFVIGLLSMAHLQSKHVGSSGFFDPEIVAAIVLIVMGSVFFGGTNKSKVNNEKESPYFEKDDDYDLSA